MSSGSGTGTTRLSALSLARALDLELSNTREICWTDPSNLVLASELAETETLINGVLRQVRILKSHLRPINRLPPEILIHIFGFLGGGSCVVPASRVCHSWRLIALGTPSLWSVIREDDDLVAARCFIERSRDMPLDLSFAIFMRDDGFAPFHDLVAVAPPHATAAARIRRLHLEVHGDRVYDFYRLLAARDFSLRALEHFSIWMNEYGFQDDSRDGDGDALLSSPHGHPPFFFHESSESLTRLTFRAALPLETQLSPAIRSLTLAERVFDLDALLGCLEAAPNLEYLALLNSVPHTFEPTSRLRRLVSLNRLRELHWFQVWVFDNVLGTVKLFEHLALPNLDAAQSRFVLLLDPSKYAIADLYTPCSRSLALFSGAGDGDDDHHNITELHLEASNFKPRKPARNTIVFHGRHQHETLFSVRVARGTLESFCIPDGIALTSSLHVPFSRHLAQLTLTSGMFPYDWNRFFRTSWTRFLCSVRTIKVLCLYVSNPIEIIAAIDQATAAAADAHADAHGPLSASSSSAPPPPTHILPELKTIHLFRRSGDNDNSNTSAASGVSDHADPTTTTTTTTTITTIESANSDWSSMFGDDNDGEGESEGESGGQQQHQQQQQILLRFLKRRADLGIPIESIVCSASDAAALLPQEELLALVDSVEIGLPGVWSEPVFPRRMIPLLEEHLG